MEFLQELLLPGNTSLAATLVLLSFVIAVGIYLGKIRFWGRFTGSHIRFVCWHPDGAFRL